MRESFACWPSNLDGGHDVGFNAAHQMALDPIVLSFDTVLVVIPAGKAGSREARESAAKSVSTDCKVNCFV